MYIVIKKDKSEKLEEKMHMIKRCVAEVMECLEEAKMNHYESDYCDNARGRDGRYMARDREEEYYREDDYRDNARGRSGGYLRGQGRY